MSEYDHKTTTIGTLPVLPVQDVAKTLTFYKDQLGFNELFNQPGENGLLVNGQVTKEGCHLMFNLNPEDAGKGGGGIYLWIRIEESDIDAYYTKLVEQNVEIVEEIKDQFWGDRSFTIKDCNGYILAFNKAI